MKVEEMAAAINIANAEIDNQQLYIIQLEQLEESGQATVEVYDAKFTRNTKMRISDFINLQQAILDDKVPYRDSLQEMYNKFQQELDTLVNNESGETVPTL